LGHDVPLNRALTARAGKVGSAIDLELLPVATHPSRDGGKIRLAAAQRRSEVFDPLPQDLTDRAVQCPDLSLGQRRRDAAGVYAGLPERLISIDIAQAGQETLIEEQWF
jgi:hypothetical protein